MGTVNLLEAVRGVSERACGRDRHIGQVLREPRDRSGVPRRRRHGRLRSVQLVEGLCRARDRRVSPVVLRRGVRCARRECTRGQRHRRRRLGARSDRPGLRARTRRRRRRSSCATRMPSARGSTSSSRCPATCIWRAGCGRGEASYDGAWNFGPQDAGHGVRFARSSMRSSRRGAPARGSSRPPRERSRTRLTCSLSISPRLASFSAGNPCTRRSRTFEATAAWYGARHAGGDVRHASPVLTSKQYVDRPQGEAPSGRCPPTESDRQ